MELKTIIPSLNSTSVNNFIRDHYSYLRWAVTEKSTKSMISLLDIGANPNGITVNGLTPKIPLTSVDFTSDNFKLIVRLLLKRGADINQQDLNGDTILTNYFKFMFDTTSKYSMNNYGNEVYFDILLFLLERGADPNGTIFYNPLYTIISIFDTIKSKYFNVVYGICETLIVYGANPNFTTIKLDKWNTNIRESARYILHNYPTGKFKGYFKTLSKLFSITVESIIKDCVSETLLHSLAKFYKVPFDNTKEGRKKLCKCIETINKNKSSYDEEKTIEIRKKLREIRKEKCSNDDLLIGAAVDSFPKSELVYLKEKNPDFTYCFHVSEIPMLLSSQRNPFNNRPLDSIFIDELVTKYKYFIPKTLEEALESTFNFNETIIDNNVLVSVLSGYIKSFNNYIQPEKIMDLNTSDLVEIQDTLYFGNRDLITRNINPSDRLVIWGESSIETKKRIIERTITYIIIRIKEENLPFVSNVVDQVIKDSETAKDIVNLFPRERRRNIIGFSRNVDYNTFTNTFDRSTGMNSRDVSSIITDKNFRNSLLKDQLEVIDYLDIGEVFSLYKKYIKVNIDELLQSRFGDVNLNVAWNDIVPAILRVVV